MTSMYFYEAATTSTRIDNLKLNLWSGIDNADKGKRLSTKRLVRYICIYRVF